MEKYHGLIIKSKLLSIIPLDDINMYLDNGQFIIKKYDKDNIIHLEGDICSSIEIILSGKVVIDSLDQDGKLLTITDFYQDDSFGSNLLFAEIPNYPMTVTALSDSVILAIHKDVIFDLLRASSVFMTAYLKLISDKTVLLGNKIKNNINKSIREKITIFLLNEQKKQKSNVVKLNFSKKKLSEKMGIQRTSLSRELRKMKDLGLIDYDNECITILKSLI